MMQSQETSSIQPMQQLLREQLSIAMKPGHKCVQKALGNGISDVWTRNLKVSCFFVPFTRERRGKDELHKRPKAY